MTLILSGTNGLSDVDGDASTPAIRGSDSNTGIFFPAADTIAFSEGGAEAMRIDSGGNLLLGGTSNPGAIVGRNLLMNAPVSAANKITFAVNGVAEGYLYQDTNELALGYPSGGSLNFQISGAGTVVKFDSSGNVLVGITTARANAGDVQVSKGISFPATQSAQSDANTLDDYEEGTFTPTAVGGTTTGTTTYTFQYGYYTKIGRQVNLTILVAWSALTGTGNLRIGNLPFTCANLSLYEAVGSCIVGDLNWSGGTQLVTSIASNEAFLSLVGCTDDAGTTAQQCVNESALIRTSITYDV